MLTFILTFQISFPSIRAILWYSHSIFTLNDAIIRCKFQSYYAANVITNDVILIQYIVFMALYIVTIVMILIYICHASILIFPSYSWLMMLFSFNDDTLCVASLSIIDDIIKNDSIILVTCPLWLSCLLSSYLLQITQNSQIALAALKSIICLVFVDGDETCVGSCHFQNQDRNSNNTLSPSYKFIDEH